MALNSAVYEGWVWHRRFRDPAHKFRYKLFMIYLDLAEIDEVLDRSVLWGREWWRPAQYRRANYHGPADVDLAESVRQTVTSALGRPVGQGPIRMLTHLRYAGLCFNPVTFYYLFNEAGSQLVAVLAEINNTPWNERHCYVLSATSDTHMQPVQMRKTFHVSPFMPMNQDYVWTFLRPAEQCIVRMENHQEGEPCFDVDLVLRRRPATSQVLTSVLARYPLMTTKVVAGIYWQALRLKMKGAAFYPHPGQSDRPTPKEQPPCQVNSNR